MREEVTLLPRLCVVDDDTFTYLYSKEGDQDNAGHLYRPAGKIVCREPLDAEFVSIVPDLVGFRVNFPARLDPRCLCAKMQERKDEEPP